MPRLGLNPARGVMSDYHPSRVTLCMLTYLPQPSGYFQDRFEVIRLSLESLILTAPDADLLVFDNGSCRLLTDHLRSLHEAGKIDYLMLSTRNVGKIGAFQVMFPAAPGELIAYSDDDIFFQPGWLDACLKVLDAYPKVGMVSGYYVRTQMKYGIESTLQFAKQPGVQAQTGRLWAKEHEQHYIENYGRDWEKYAQDTEAVEDMLLNWKGVDAYVSAQHMQFVSPRSVLVEALPKNWSGHLMGQMRELDAQVDQLGYLRLSTPQPVTRFLGNQVSPEMARQAQAMGTAVRGQESRQPKHPLRFLLRSGRINLWLWKVYSSLFDLLNSAEKKP